LVVKADRKREELEKILSSCASDVENISREGRKLRIGVVGQVKSGKSSFLNALIFEGKGILPKAATPMTAALTVMTHAPEVRAEVEFYSENDWKGIERTAAEYDAKVAEIERRLSVDAEEQDPSEQGTGASSVDDGFGGSLVRKLRHGKRRLNREEILACADRELHDDVKASKELVEMAAQSGIDLRKHLGAKITLEGISTMEHLMERLDEYVGVDGKYTPIVRNTTIFCDSERMTDIEIVDTPGINDPVVSRGSATKDYLKTCDVVFFLSQCSQFVDSVDLELLVQNLPSSGVDRIVLVGSQFDSVLIGEKEKYARLPALMKGVLSELEKRVEALLQSLYAKSRNAGETKIIEALRREKPLFISSMAYNIAAHYDDPSEEEIHFLRLYNGLYPGTTFSREMLEDFSNIEGAAKKLKEIRDEKEEILARRLGDFIAGTERKRADIVFQIRDVVESEKRKVEKGDVERLKRQVKEVAERLENGRERVESIFLDTLKKCDKDLSGVEYEIEQASSLYKNIETREKKQEESYFVSTSKWWNPFSWGNTETRYRTIKTPYMDVHDAIEQIERFVSDTRERLKVTVREMIDAKAMKKAVRETAMELFDMSDPSFSLEDVRGPINELLDSLAMPSIDFESRKYKEIIVSSFSSSTVSESEMESLRNAQRDAIAAVLDDMRKTVAATRRETSERLKRAREAFVDTLVGRIEKDRDETCALLQDREKNLEKLALFLRALPKNAQESDD